GPGNSMGDDARPAADRPLPSRRRTDQTRGRSAHARTARPVPAGARAAVAARSLPADIRKQRIDRGGRSLDQRSRKNRFRSTRCTAALGATRLMQVGLIRGLPRKKPNIVQARWASADKAGAAQPTGWFASQHKYETGERIP